MMKMIFIPAVLSPVLLLLVTVANAQRSWTGATSANWSTTSNWSPSGVPNSTETITFPAAGANKSINYNVTGGSTHNLLSFTGSGYTLSSSNTLTVSGTSARIEATHADGTTNISTPLVLAGGTVRSMNGASLRFNSAATINLGAGTGGLTVDARSGSSIRLTGNISGTSTSATITMADVGSVLINGNHSFQGLYNIQSGSTTLLNTIQGRVIVQPLASFSVIGGRTTKDAEFQGNLSAFQTFTVDGNLMFGTQGRDVNLSLSGPLPATGYSQIRVGGSVKTGGQRIKFDPSGGYLPGTEFVFIRKDSVGLIDSTTKFLLSNGGPMNEGTLFNQGTHRFRFSYQGGDGNDFSATVVSALYDSVIVDWDGGGTGSDWVEAANWSGDARPAAGQNVRFGQTATLKTTIANDMGGHYGAIRFAGTTGGFTIDNPPPSATPNLIVLTGSVAGAGVHAQHAGADCVIKSPLFLDGTQTWTLTGSGGLTFHQDSALEIRSLILTLNCSPSAGSPMMVFNCPITGTGGRIITTGTGVVSFGAAAKTYTGDTFINSPSTLLVDSSMAGHTNVHPGATLGGSGTVGSVINEGTIRPGGPTTRGRLTTAGNMNFFASGETRLLLRLGAPTTAGVTYDQLRCQSGLTIESGTALTLETASGFTGTVGQTYTLIDKASAGAIVGTFFGLPQGGFVDIDSRRLQISYTGGDGNDLTATVVNATPTISDVPNQTIDEDTSTGLIPFTVGDLENAPGSLSVTRASSNTSVIPLANVVLGGSGANRTVTVTPAPNQFGSATITLSVSDASASASDTFLVTVNPVNDRPTISDIPNQTIDEDTSTGAIPFTVGDIETSAASLTVTPAATDIGLLPLPNIVLGGSGANRTVTVTPGANRSGSASILIIVSDGSLNASDSFLVTVNPVNDPPTFMKGPDLQLPFGSGPQSIPGWATAISDGDPDFVQTLTFEVTNDNNALFSVQPALSANGGLTHTPQPGASGSALVSVALTDDATAGGPALTSPVQTFVITIQPPDAPPALSNIAFTPATATEPAKFSATVTGPPNAAVLLEASRNLGELPDHLWTVIHSFNLDANGEAVLTDIPHPGSEGFKTDFFRVRFD